MQLKLDYKECINSINEYINELEDMQFAIENLNWDMQATELIHLNESGNLISQAIQLLKKSLINPKIS